MKWLSDPTADKSDMMPLTPEENAAILMAAIAMVFILIVASGIIYFIICK
jgi:hypothetical protein